MKKNISFISKSACIAVLIILDSCTKFITIDPPKTQLVTQTVFATDETAEAAMAGAYAFYSPNYYNFNDLLTVTSDYAAGDAVYELGDPSSDEFATNSLTPSNPYLATMWSVPYQCIYECNAILEGISSSTGISETKKNQLTGESEFLRAFGYFYLRNLFGDVPLVLTTDVSKTSLLARSKSTDVYQQIIHDLTDAMAKLPADNGGNIRANQAAAEAMLARVYLYTGDWPDAEKIATQLIGSGSYSLEPDLTRVFLAGSPETIFQFSTQQGFTFLGAYYIPQSIPSIPPLILTDYLTSAFDPLDQRKNVWTMSEVNEGINYTYPFKYKQTGPNSGDGMENYTVLRLAEQYLIRAEARAMQNEIPEAADDLNAIRSRAGLPPTNATDQLSMLSAIENERRFELFYEWGHRWLDLKRTNRVNTVMGALKPTWKATDSLYPIPQLQISANPNLAQNAGY